MVQGLEDLLDLLFQQSKIENDSLAVQAIRNNGNFDLPVVAVKFLAAALEVSEPVGAREVRVDRDFIHGDSSFGPSLITREYYKPKGARIKAFNGY